MIFLYTYLMQYSKIVHGKFIDRPNRFIAHVEVDGKIETVHVKNTGRCKELLLPGVEVILEDFRDVETKRKTLFDLIAVYKIYPEKPGKAPVLINMDSQAPNKVVYEWLKNQSEYTKIVPEFSYGKSRVDFYMETEQRGQTPYENMTSDRGDRPLLLQTESNQRGQTLMENPVQKCLLEVKGCTLEVDGQGYFPDAPTERGVKHLRELAGAQKMGYECFIAFVIQIPGVKTVLPNIKTHPEFGVALEEAKAAGVKVLFLKCEVWDSGLKIIDN